MSWHSTCKTPHCDSNAAKVDVYPHVSKVYLPVPYPGGATKRKKCAQGWGGSMHTNASIDKHVAAACVI
jgi:hypothetical protein